MDTEDYKPSEVIKLKANCRVCLKISDNKVLIDDVFVQAYKMLTNLDVYLNDGLSQHVCVTCIDVIKSFIEFRNRCVDIESYQRKLLEECKQDGLDIEIKNESIEFIEDITTKDEQSDTDMYIEPFDSQELFEETKEDVKLEVRRSKRKLKPKTKSDNFPVPKPKSNTKIKTNAKVKTNDKVNANTEVKTNTKVKSKEEEKIEINIELEENTQIPCGLCKIRFNNKTELSNHLDTHKSIFHCEICHETLHRWYQALAHRSVHIPTNKLNCYRCDKEYSNADVLAVHYMKVHKETIPADLQCKTCFTTFSYRRYLTRHERESHGEKRFICDYCNKTVKSKELMKSHIKIHSEIKPFKCEFCDYSTRYQSSLVSHIYGAHSAVKCYCRKCNRHFKNEEKLINHKCRKYMCPVCGKTVTKIHKHMQTHNSARSYKCERCPSSFKTKHTLDEHIDRHNGFKRYKCDYCPRAFYCKASTYKHHRTHTGERPYPCKRCGKAFKANHNLKVHMQVHGEFLIKKRNAPESELMSLDQL